MSEHLLRSVPFRFMRARFGIRGDPAAMEQRLKNRLFMTLDECRDLDAAVVLAFDRVHHPDGTPDEANTHLHVTNDYVMELARQHPKVLFGCSVHPYRRDAVAELERCARAGAVLVKWLPIVQNFNPSDPTCIPFYDALAGLNVPLLSHTGGEQALPNLDPSVADPELLRPALKRGVRVIMAHCGTRSTFREPDFVPSFMRLAKEFEHCYGDTSALDLPARWSGLRRVVDDPQVRKKLLHGSDWPIIAIPRPSDVGWLTWFRLMLDPNWMRRDMRAKRAIGLELDYWTRASTVLRLHARAARGTTTATAPAPPGPH